METATTILKLRPVLDMAGAEELLVTLRQRASAAEKLRLDASDVRSITTPCIQLILAAARRGSVSVVSPSQEFAAAFADMGLACPLSEPAEELPSKDAVQTEAPPLQPALEQPTATRNEGQIMKKRILTIDDSKTIRDMLKMTLVDAGFEVLQAVDGHDGLAMMEREQVDLVITDINMPKMNGYEVVRHLRGIPAHRGLPILMLTTESDSDKKNLAREAGATGWMVKPFDPDRLVATVRRVIP